MKGGVMETAIKQEKETTIEQKKRESENGEVVFANL